MSKRKWLEYGGIVSGVILIAFGIGAVGMSINGHNTVVSALKAEGITSEATSGMNPTQIAEDAKAAGVPETISLPTCSVEGKDINSSSRARCFAEYMRIHALEASGGLTYSQLGRYAAKDGSPEGTSDFAAAATDPKTGKPLPNSTRDTWVTETALSTALNVSYMADNLALFGIVVGIALLLSGIGFMILAVLALGGAARTTEKAPEAVPPGVPVSG
jgi:F0F1-type ATP synthase membrane subunit c/vacuolar-type H+-ATPase subunit K